MGERLEDMVIVNRWVLTNELKNEWLPKIKDFLEGKQHPACQGQCVSSNTVCGCMETNPFKKDEYRCVYDFYDLSGTVLSPHTLTLLLMELGYGENWKLETTSKSGRIFNIKFPQKDGDDFWINIYCCAMSFKLSLEKEFL